MRIGIDIRCLADGKRTGVEEYVFALLVELFEQDTDNQYILFFNAWGGKVPDFGWATKYRNVTLRVFRFPNKLLNLALWYLRFPKLDQLIGGVDIFFLPNLNFVAVSDKARLIVTAHDLSFELFPETFSWKQRVWHYFVNFRQLVRRADRVIAVSYSTKNDLMAQYRVSGEKVTVIHSGVGPQFRVMSRNDAGLVAVKEKYALPYKYILYLGTFEPRKNISSLIRAYDVLLDQNSAAYGKYALVLAGTRGWECDEIFSTIAASKHRDKILLPGFIDDADKTALYNLASVFVYPSFYEGFGFPPLEAMACGVPVITSHSSSLPEIVGDAGIMIDPYQPDELLRALEGLLSDQDLCQAFQVSGPARAARFSWRETAKAVLVVFRSV